MFKDPIAAKRVEELILKYNVVAAIETGTFDGESTVKLSKLVPFVFTTEINKDNFWAAVQRFGNSGYQKYHHDKSTESLAFSNNSGRCIRIFNKNSPDAIKSIFRVYYPLPEPILFYLDAHGNEYCPLLDELKAIAKEGVKHCIIIIHDFKVPGKPFGYDSYNGHDFDYDYVKDDLLKINREFKISYNEEASGNMRGILYALPK